MKQSPDVTVKDNWTVSVERYMSCTDKLSRAFDICFRE